MNEYFLAIGYWHWIGFGVALLLVELFTGTGFLLWIGISSFFVAFLLYLFHTISLDWQLILFSLMSLSSTTFWWFYLHYYPTKREKSTLNRRAEQYIGREFTLNEPIINGMGTVHVDDSMWRLKCKRNFAKGTVIRITGADGVILIGEQSHNA